VSRYIVQCSIFNLQYARHARAHACGCAILRTQRARLASLVSRTNVEHYGGRRLLTRYSVRRKPCSRVVDATTRFIIQKAAGSRVHVHRDGVHVAGRQRLAVSRMFSSLGVIAPAIINFQAPATLGASQLPPLSSSRCRIPSPFVASR